MRSANNVGNAGPHVRQTFLNDVHVKTPLYPPYLVHVLNSLYFTHFLEVHVYLNIDFHFHCQ
jgi:hypothetical protein